MKTNIARTARRLVRSEPEAYFDDAGCPNYTRLAEDTAHDLNHDEWLDDPDHEVWDVAVQVLDTQAA